MAGRRPHARGLSVAQRAARIGPGAALHHAMGRGAGARGRGAAAPARRGSGRGGGRAGSRAAARAHRALAGNAQGAARLDLRGRGGDDAGDLERRFARLALAGAREPGARIVAGGRRRLRRAVGAAARGRAHPWPSPPPARMGGAAAPLPGRCLAPAAHADVGAAHPAAVGHRGRRAGLRGAAADAAHRRSRDRHGQPVAASPSSSRSSRPASSSRSICAPSRTTRWSSWHR